jgi:2'-5' RNA ligase
MRNRRMSEGDLRCFIAVEVADTKILDHLLELGKALTATGATVKLVEAQNIHATLRFLGNVSRSRVEEVVEVLDEVEFHPFDVELKGVGVFPNLRRVNVVWVGIERGDVELLNVFNQLEAKLKGIGFKPDRRGFSPHITIARVSSGRNRDALVDVVSDWSAREFGVYEVDAIQLKKSVLTPRGPIYSTLHEASARQREPGREAS